MDDVLTRIWTDLVGRLSGPLTLRLFLQPTMAVFFAIRDGVRDARTGRPPYFWALVSHSGERRRLLAEEWKSIGKLIVVAVVLDIVYQVIVFQRIYPFEMLAVIVIIAVLPYTVLRGAIGRFARSRSGA